MSEEKERSLMANDEWLVDANDNRASIVYFGDREKAQAALDSLNNCYNCANCIDCSYCSACIDCSNCSDCLACSACSNCSDCIDCSNCSYCTRNEKIRYHGISQMKYIIEHKGNQFTPDGKTEVQNVSERDKAIDEQNLKIWNSKPDQYGAYVDGDYVITRLGRIIGRVYISKRYTNNFGAKLRYVRVRGLNGAYYYGTYGDKWNMFIRLRRYK